MSKSALGDTSILNATTKTTNERGYAQLAYVLPSGRKVISEWINPDQLKGQVFIQWCNVVRDQDEADIVEREAAEEAAAAAKQRRLASSPAPSTDHVPVPIENLRSSKLGSEVLSAETLPASSTPSLPVSAPPPPSRSGLPDDPTDLAVQKLNGLRLQLAEVQDQLSELSVQEERLVRAIARWETVVASLAEPSAVMPSAPSARLPIEPPGPRELGGAPMPLIYVPSTK